MIIQVFFQVLWFFHAWNFFADFPGFPWFQGLEGTLPSISKPIYFDNIKLTTKHGMFKFLQFSTHLPCLIQLREWFTNNSKQLRDWIQSLSLGIIEKIALLEVLKSGDCLCWRYTRNCRTLGIKRIPELYHLYYKCLQINKRTQSDLSYQYFCPENVSLLIISASYIQIHSRLILSWKQTLCALIWVHMVCTIGYHSR